VRGANKRGEERKRERERERERERARIKESGRWRRMEGNDDGTGKGRGNGPRERWGERKINGGMRDGRRRRRRGTFGYGLMRSHTMRLRADRIRNRVASEVDEWRDKRL